VQELPAPNAPTKDVPSGIDVPATPPARGTGRVLIDANGEHARVIEVTGAFTASAGGQSATIVGTRSVCTAPCVVDLPFGSHSLLLQSTKDPTRQSEEDINVGAQAKVFRHALGEQKDGGPLRTVGNTLAGLGALAALTGGILWGTGALVNSSADTSGSSRSSLDGTGKLITAVGLGTIVLGIPFLILGRPSKRPGATTEWTLPGGVTAPGEAPVVTGGTAL
jgi:hypothetical protein